MLSHSFFSIPNTANKTAHFDLWTNNLLFRTNFLRIIRTSNSTKDIVFFLVELTTDLGSSLPWPAAATGSGLTGVFPHCVEKFGQDAGVSLKGVSDFTKDSSASWMLLGWVESRSGVMWVSSPELLQSTISSCERNKWSMGVFSLPRHFFIYLFIFNSYKI